MSASAEGREATELIISFQKNELAVRFQKLQKLVKGYEELVELLQTKLAAAEEGEEDAWRAHVRCCGRQAQEAEVGCWGGGCVLDIRGAQGNQ